MKKINLGIVTLIIFFLFNSTTVFAAIDIVDNDSLSDQPGYSSQHGTWTYQTSSSSIYGDHRITSAAGKFGTATSNTYYTWIFYAHNKSAYHYVHLRNAGFTNPRTAYQIDQTGGLVYINQNTAPNGWNYLATHQDYTHMIAINSYHTSGTGNVGVDAAKISY